MTYKHAMRFVWDSDKEAVNRDRHGIDFTTAAQAFNDPNAVEIFDMVHSQEGEDRWTTIGLVDGVLMLVSVTWTDRDGDDVIRIISARPADPRDRALYQPR